MPDMPPGQYVILVMVSGLGGFALWEVALASVSLVRSGIEWASKI